MGAYSGGINWGDVLLVILAAVVVAFVVFKIAERGCLLCN